MPRVSCCPLLLLVACAPKAGDAGDDSTGAPVTAADHGGGSTGAPTTGGAAETHGFVCLRLMPGEGVGGDVFAGTAKLRVTMSYEPCLIDFYATRHPEERLDGPVGGELFDEWKTRLCSEPIADPVACSIESFEQVIDPDGVTPLYNMAITYEVADAAAIAGRTLLWGPLPLAAHAGCEPDTRPYVRLTGLSDVIGLDAGGTPLWSLQSYGEIPRVESSLTTEVCLQLPISD